MELVADDRERAVIQYLVADAKIKIRVERITVGDYAIIFNGVLIAIIERKTLADLAASIKDGRMSNNNKLMEARTTSGCRVIYIIEGSAYPSSTRKYGGLPFKCLQGKLDSLMFHNNVNIIWTKNAQHTATRLETLFLYFKKHHVAPPPVEGGVKTPLTTNLKTPSKPALGLIKKKHVQSMDSTHLTLLTSLRGVGYNTAMVVLKRYTLHDVLNNKADPLVMVDLLYPGGFRLGKFALTLTKHCKTFANNVKAHAKMLASINGITLPTARIILTTVPFLSIVNNTFKKGDIANIKKTETRRVGEAVENNLIRVFTPVKLATPAEPIHA
jgi:ERCC4-type nuclease